MHSYCSDEGENEDIHSLEVCLIHFILRFCHLASLQSCTESANMMFFTSRPKLENTQKLEGSLEPEPLDILVDTVISFLERSTGYFRTVGNLAFSLLSGSVKGSSIDLILAVSYALFVIWCPDAKRIILQQLERRDPMRDEDGDENMQDGGDDWSNSEASNDNEDSNDNEGSNEHAGDDGDSSDGEETDPEVRKQMEEVFVVTGLKSVSKEDEEGDDDNMDDEQKLAIDDKLADVFRSRANEKKLGKGMCPFFASNFIFWINQNLLQTSTPRGKPHTSRIVFLTLLTCS